MPEIGRVVNHHASHESGGSDEIDVSGLTPKVHASTHYAAGTDRLPVSSLDGWVHAANHEDGGSDEIDLSGLSGLEITVPYNGKIADISIGDTNKHTIDLAAALSESRSIVAAILFASRQSGTGDFNAYPNEGATGVSIRYNYYNMVVVLLDGTNRVQYAQTVGGDDWDVYCMGYIVRA